MPDKKINAKELLNSMLIASKNVLKKEWKTISPIAELQLKNIVHNLEQIAVVMLVSLLLIFEGIGIIIAEKAINAALNTIKNTFNKAIGWKLL